MALQNPKKQGKVWKKWTKIVYRTRAINRRSHLVAAPKDYKLKTIFYLFFMWQSKAKIIIFD